MKKTKCEHLMIVVGIILIWIGILYAGLTLCFRNLYVEFSIIPVVIGGIFISIFWNRNLGE